MITLRVPLVYALRQCSYLAVFLRLPRWLDVWRAEFSGVGGIEKGVLQWEARQPTASALRQATQGRRSRSRVGRRADGVTPSPDVVSGGARRVEGDLEWRAVIEMAVARTRIARISPAGGWSSIVHSSHRVVASGGPTGTVADRWHRRVSSGTTGCCASSGFSPPSTRAAGVTTRLDLSYARAA